MAYLCDWCGEVFDEPDTATVTENLDGERGLWRRTETFCPSCGSDHFRIAPEPDEEEYEE